MTVITDKLSGDSKLLRETLERAQGTAFVAPADSAAMTSARELFSDRATYVNAAELSGDIAEVATEGRVNGPYKTANDIKETCVHVAATISQIDSDRTATLVLDCTRASREQVGKIAYMFGRIWEERDVYDCALSPGRGAVLLADESCASIVYDALRASPADHQLVRLKENDAAK